MELLELLYIFMSRNELAVLVILYVYFRQAKQYNENENPAALRRKRKRY